MGRDIHEERNQNQQREAKNQNQFKLDIEKGVILIAFLIIVATVFLLPKYETYAANKQILEEKNNLNSGFPKEMTEAEYLTELGKIREELEGSKKNIPDMIDSVGLYSGSVQMAEEAGVELLSIKFHPIDTQMDDALGRIIEKEFLENEEKTIEGPDGRYLAKCSFRISCSGDALSCVRFLQAIENYQPIMKVIDFEIKGEALSEKTMTINLESYGTIDEETIPEANQDSLK